MLRQPKAHTKGKVANKYRMLHIVFFVASQVNMHCFAVQLLSVKRQSRFSRSLVYKHDVGVHGVPIRVERLLDEGSLAGKFRVCNWYGPNSHRLYRTVNFEGRR